MNLLSTIDIQTDSNTIKIVVIAILGLYGLYLKDIIISTICRTFGNSKNSSTVAQGCSKEVLSKKHSEEEIMDGHRYITPRECLAVHQAVDARLSANTELVKQEFNHLKDTLTRVEKSFDDKNVALVKHVDLKFDALHNLIKNGGRSN